MSLHPLSPSYYLLLMLREGSFLSFPSCTSWCVGKKKSHFATQPSKLQVPTKIHTDNTGCHGNTGASMAWQQQRNKFTDIRGFFNPLLTSVFRESQPFWREDLISDSFHFVIASLADRKVLANLFWTAAGCVREFMAE